MSVSILAVPILLAAIFSGPEHQLTAPSFGAGHGLQYSADLASDGTGFLALWIEPTPGREGLHAVAIDERAATRSLPPRMIARGQIHQAHVVWTGDEYLAVWADIDTRKMSAVRISRDGQPAGPPRVVGDGLFPTDLAWNGRSALAVVRTNDFRTQALSLAGDGTIERTTTLPTAGTIGVGISVTVAAAGETFLVTWIETVGTTNAGGEVTSTTAIKAMRFDDGGASLDAAPAAVPLIADLRNGIWSISAVSDGERVGLAFVSIRTPAGDPEALRTYIIDPRTMAITATASRPVVSEVDAVATPRGFLAATRIWIDGQAVLVLTPFDGSPATEITLGNGASEFMFARSAGAVMAVWADFRFGRHLFGAPLNESATSMTGKAGMLAPLAVAQVNPVVAPAGDHALLVWIELMGADFGDVMAVRVDRNGNALGTPVILGTGAYSGYRTPSVVFTGQVWLVAWAGARQLEITFVRRVAADGRRLDEVDDFQGASCDLASNGSVSVLALKRADGMSITRFSPAGRLLDTLQAPAGTGYEPRLATNGREFLLVWMEGTDHWQFPSPNYRDVMALRLDAGGMVLGSPVAVSNGPLDEGEPVVAGSDGGDFLVLYSHDKSSVRAKTVSREGVAGEEKLVASDPLPLALIRGRSGYVAAVANGLESNETLISVLQLDRSGVPTSPPELISRSEAPWREASLAAMNDSLLAAYSRTVAGLPFENVPRLLLRTLKESSRRRAVR